MIRVLLAVEHHRGTQPALITAIAMVRQIHGSPANRIRLSGQNANPQLLNAEIAWNTLTSKNAASGMARR
ncbi:hypothetical protein [Nonomuraea sp. JJY05]|uniref:hypothetical protein n=1 Tax=Nonomuraea sp. JJY05 TaxID=3350255 RepID=UPI00373F7A84